MGDSNQTTTKINLYSKISILINIYFLFFNITVKVSYLISFRNIKTTVETQRMRLFNKKSEDKIRSCLH